MFEQPPTLFLPLRAALANLTSWFDWEALGAIGTVGALWFAVIQLTRSARAERLRADGILTSLISFVEPVATHVPELEGDRDGNAKAADISYLLDCRPMLERAKSGLEHFGVLEAASVGMSEYVAALPVALGELLEQLPKTLSGKVRADHFNMSLLYIVEAADALRRQRDLLRYGWLGTWIRSQLRVLGDRFYMWRHQGGRRKIAAAARAEAACEPKART